MQIGWLMLCSYLPQQHRFDQASLSRSDRQTQCPAICSLITDTNRDTAFYNTFLGFLLVLPDGSSSFLSQVDDLTCQLVGFKCDRPLNLLSLDRFLALLTFLLIVLPVVVLVLSVVFLVLPLVTLLQGVEKFRSS